MIEESLPDSVDDEQRDRSNNLSKDTFDSSPRKSILKNKIKKKFITKNSFKYLNKKSKNRLARKHFARKILLHQIG